MFEHDARALALARARARECVRVRVRARMRPTLASQPQIYICIIFNTQMRILKIEAGA
jgi:hypothetical protein